MRSEGQAWCLIGPFSELLAADGGKCRFGCPDGSGNGCDYTLCASSSHASLSAEARIMPGCDSKSGLIPGSLGL